MCNKRRNQKAEHGDVQEVKPQAKESARGARLKKNTGDKHKERRNATYNERRNDRQSMAMYKQGKASNGKLKEKYAVPASQARSLNKKSLHAMAVEMPLNIKMWH